MVRHQLGDGTTSPSARIIIADVNLGQETAGRWAPLECPSDGVSMHFDVAAPPATLRQPSGLERSWI